MNTNDALHHHEELQTPFRGTSEQEYEIYVASAEALGWEVKTFDEWLNS